MTNAFQQLGGGFVGRILRHEFALEGAPQNGLTQADRALDGVCDLHLGCVGDGQAAIDLGNDFDLLGKRRQPDWNGPNLRKI